jgi:hypothetical protein
VCGNSARTDLCGGRPAMGVPTANSVSRWRVSPVEGGPPRELSIALVADERFGRAASWIEASWNRLPTLAMATTSAARRFSG